MPTLIGRRQTRLIKTNLVFSFVLTASKGQLIFVSKTATFVDRLTATKGQITLVGKAITTLAVPVSVVAPVVSGTTTVGSVLSCTTGTWTNSPTSYTYQWYRAVTSGGVPITDGNGNYVGVAISGAADSTYTLVAGDEDEFIFCDVRASNASGPSVLVESSNYVGLITDAWTPASLGADLVAWYTAKAGVTLSGSDVTAWADQSGSGVGNLTPILTGVVSYNATGFNGLPTLDFPGLGSGSVRLQSGAAALPMDADTSSWYVVAKRETGTASFAGLVGFTGNGQTEPFNNAASVGCLNFDSGLALISYYNSVGYSTAAFSIDTHHWAGVIFDGVNEKMYVDGALQDTDAVVLNLATTGRLCVGACGTATNNLNGQISEVIVVKRALTNDERAALDAYFEAEWGL